MKFIPQAIPEIILIKPDIHTDDRGYFFESFHSDQFEKALGLKINFVQDNESLSTRGVLRGLHFQIPPFAQSKLIRVIQGSILDIVVDIRKGSPNFGKHVAIEINDKNKHQCFIPRGFAHGFIVLSDKAVFSYKVDNFYSPKHDRGISYKDKNLNIDWLMPDEEIIVSKQDQKQESLKNMPNYFDYKVNYYKSNK